jgi:hypothetical protein
VHLPPLAVLREDVAMGMRTRWIAGVALALLLTGCSQSGTSTMSGTVGRAGTATGE